VDHQLDDSQGAPVVLAPTPVANPQPTIQLSIIKDNGKSKNGLESFEYVAALLQEMDVRVQETVFFAVWLFLQEKSNRQREMRKSGGLEGKGKEKEKEKEKVKEKEKEKGKEGKEKEKGKEGKEKGKGKGKKKEKEKEKEKEKDKEKETEKEVKNGQNFSNRKLYIEQLVLGSVKVNITYVKSDEKIHTFSISNNLVDVDTDDDSALSNLPLNVSAVIPSLTGAPVRLNGKHIEHVFETAGEILTSLQRYYTNELLRQIYKLLGR